MASAAERLQTWGAETAIVLGSGLSSLVDDAAGAEEISYREIPELPQANVAGHAGRFVLEKIKGAPVIYAQGRVHLYEGHDARAVTAGIRLLARSGVKRLILTNAAGSVNAEFPPGSWMMISDHLNLTGTSSLVGAPQFIDMSGAYSPSWRRHFAQVAAGAGIDLHEGVYAGLLGPQYETPAEVRMLRSLGADAVGMSTVLETIQARALGLEVAGFSCLTNWAAGIGSDQLSHGDVLEVGRNAARDFARLLQTTR
ncbi:MAG: purine-nucleoside phosphorylase [Verrucomicrobiota bacterium]|nr:purine-nucleoside phosphorylase [Verrucomicrobiota bacterium]